MADSPVSTTAVFGTSGFSSAVTGIGIEGQERVAIETSHFGTTGFKEYIAAKLVEPGEITLEVQFDPDDIPPISGAAETLTITFPLPTGQSTAANVAGTGFVTSWSASLEDQDGLMTAEVTFKWDGLTGPTFTASA